MRFIQFVLVLTGCLIPVTLYPQKKLTGVVVDAITKIPVENANIQSGRNITASTGPRGQFNLNIGSLPVKLKVTHVSYFSKEIIISGNPDDSLVIDLMPRTQNIDEVTITGRPYTQYFKTSSFYIEDFAIQRDKIWAIGFPDKNILKPELRLLNIDGKVLDHMAVRQNSSLYQDPTGTIHIYDRDSVCQLYFDGTRIGYAYRNPMDESAEVLFNLQVIKGDTVVFREFNVNRSYCEFIAANPVAGTRDTIFGSYNRNLFKSGEAAQGMSFGPIPTCEIAPSPPGHMGGAFPSELRRIAIETGEHPEYAQMSDKDIMQAVSNNIPTKTLKDVGSEQTRNSRTAFTNYAFNRTITNRAVRAEMFCNHNLFTVFESTNLMLWRLGADFHIIDSFIIGLNPDAKEVRMIQDPVGRQLFLSYRINGTCFISLVDSSSGLISKTREIKGFPFAEKVRVYNGRIYFIYQMATGQTFTNLFSIPL